MSSAADKQHDEPTVDDTPISEYPLEIVDQRGREYAIVICTGGPCCTLRLFAGIQGEHVGVGARR